MRTRWINTTNVLSTLIGFLIGVTDIPLWWAIPFGLALGLLAVWVRDRRRA